MKPPSWVRIETLVVSCLFEVEAKATQVALASILITGRSKNELFNFIVAGTKLVIIPGTPDKHGLILE